MSDSFEVDVRFTLLRMGLDSDDLARHRVVYKIFIGVERRCEVHVHVGPY